MYNLYNIKFPQEMTNYRLQCENQMRSDKMIPCTRECQLAYGQLLSRRPHGEAIIEQECDELGVKNVKLSCIREGRSGKVSCYNVSILIITYIS